MKLGSMKNKKIIGVLNILILFILLGLFSFGLLSFSVAKNGLDSEQVDYDAKLKGGVGKEYSLKQHSKVVSVLESNEASFREIAKSMKKLSMAIFQLCSIAFVILLMNTFFLFKNHTG